MSVNKRLNWLVFVLFFLSGACGLIYEVVWSRMMTLIFGRSILAVGIVLAAFMLGLALGSYLFGRYADRSRKPLRLYAMYEAGIALTAIITSFCLTWITPLYVRVHEILGGHPLVFTLARFLIAFAILIVPTSLMGATLPILSRVIVKRLAKVGQELGMLYAINTVGAVAGSFMAGFYLIGHIGLYGAIGVAVIGNLAVAVSAWLASASGPTDIQDIPEAMRDSAVPLSADPPILERPADPAVRRTYHLVLWAFALSGLTSFAYEIFWTRSLVFLLGSTTYAFTLMLTAFLSGIALGGYGIRFLGDLMKPLRLFSIIEILIGILSAVALPLLFYIVKSQAIHSFVIRYSGRIELLALSDFVISLSFMLLPATLIGATLPLMGRIFVSDLNRAGTTIGKIYAVNTLGNVVGALLPGIVIMPIMGIQKGILLMAFLNICIGASVLFSKRRHALALASTTIVLFLIFAASLARIPISFQFPSEYQRPKDEVLYYREGGLVTTKVWVSADTGYKVMSVDGINIGGTSDSDYKQQILAHLPKLLLKSYRSELSIGLGSGILAGESARHAALEKITTVEISRGVVEGARYFSEENYNILDDPRSALVVDDVADFLRTTDKRFDIISADEKTTGKYATNSFSYSKDYYELLRKRLTPGGLVIQWMPTDLPPPQYNLALRTFLDGFPHVQLWYFPPIGTFTMTNTVLIGSNDPVAIDPAWMGRVLESESGPFAGIRKYGLTTAEAVLTHFVGTEATLRRAVPAGPVNTFEEPRYEFYSPGDYAAPPDDRTLVNHELLLSIRGRDFDSLIRQVTAEPASGRLTAAFHAEAIFLAGHRAQLQGRSAQDVLGYYDEALKTAPGNWNLRNEIISYLTRQSIDRYFDGDIAGAAAFLGRAVELYPENGDIHYNYGWMLGKMNQMDSAVAELQRALAMNARLVPAKRTLASIYASRGQAELAAEQWKEALAIDPRDVSSLVGYGIFLAEQRPSAEAIEYLREAVQMDPEDPEVIDGYARVEYLSGNIAEAKRIILKGGDYYKSNPNFEQLRAVVLGIS